MRRPRGQKRRLEEPSVPNPKAKREGKGCEGCQRGQNKSTSVEEGMLGQTTGRQELRLCKLLALRQKQGWWDDLGWVWETPKPPWAWFWGPLQ